MTYIFLLQSKQTLRIDLTGRDINGDLGVRSWNKLLLQILLQKILKFSCR